MASVGPNYPGTVSTEAVGTENDTDWTNPSNVAADDGAEATIDGGTLDSGNETFRINATNFGFTLPAGATIDGIVVEVRRRVLDVGDAAEDFTVQLRSAGALVGNNKADTVTAYTTTATTVTYGGVTDLWGWTPGESDIESSTFGLSFSASATTANANPAVNFIRITVHYTAAGGAADLVIQEASLALAAATPALTQVHNLAVAGASLALAAQVPSLTQVHNLAVAAAAHNLAAEAMALVQQHQLETQDATMLSQAEGLSLVQVHLLAVSAAAMALAGENVALTATHELVVQNALLALSAEGVELTIPVVAAVVEALWRQQRGDEWDDPGGPAWVQD